MSYDNVSLDGKVVFYKDNHKYELLNDKKLKFTSVTTLLKQYHEHFDSDSISKTASEKAGSIYYGMSTNDIQKLWSDKAKKASGEGTLLHAYAEDLLNGRPTTPAELTKRKWVPKAIDDMFNKFKYELAKTELLVYSELVKVAGQSDIILKKKWSDDEHYSYAIYDWKFLGKAIEMKSFYNRSTREYKKMFFPFQHLLDCNWIHYSIQLAIYQTMSGDAAKIKEKVLVVVYDDSYEFVPCYPMRVFWDTANQLQAVYEIFNGKIYDSRVDKILDKWPSDIVGR